jgi:hypothetical protein
MTKGLEGACGIGLCSLLGFPSPLEEEDKRLMEQNYLIGPNLVS